MEECVRQIPAMEPVSQDIVDESTLMLDSTTVKVQQNDICYAQKLLEPFDLRGEIYYCGQGL